MLASASAVAAMAAGGRGSRGGGSKYFGSGGRGGGRRTQFEVGLVKFEVRDANVKTGGKPAMTAIVRRMLAIVQKGDESAVLLPIGNDGTPRAAIQNAEALKDDGTVNRYVKDVTLGDVRGTRGDKGVRFTLRLRTTARVSQLKYHERILPS